MLAVMTQQREVAHRRLEDLATPYLALPGVDWGRMFGTTGLRVRSKIFAVAAHDGGLMIKVPEAEADRLVDDGLATRVVMAGVPRREWVVVPNSASDDVWAEQLDVAYTYVDSITP
ncbi:MAG: hypothetical protein JWP31_49 [Aeromicrobium sp.]|nr:hypothetical protein [Aeromicrobium sp.]